MYRGLVFLCACCLVLVAGYCGNASDGSSESGDGDLPMVFDPGGDGAANLVSDLAVVPDDSCSENDCPSPGCLSDDDCVSLAPYCHPSSGQCVSCVLDQHCAHPQGICDAENGVCVDCLKDDDCGPYGTAAFTISLRKGTQGYTISYSWSYRSNQDSKTHKFVRPDEDGWNWTQGQWNHYSNCSPKGFDLDDIELIPLP